MDTKGILKSVINNGRKYNQPEEGDYQNDQGLWMCGKCHGAREMIKYFEQFEQEEKVWVMCECRQHAEKKYQENYEARRKEMMDAASRENHIKHLRQLKDTSLMGEKLKDAYFNKAITTKSNEINLKWCRNYVEKFATMKKNSQGFLFWGDVGTGKTFAAGCIANELLDRGVPVMATSMIKLIDRLSAFKKNGYEEDVAKLMRKLTTVDLLIIDELGAERETPFVIEKMFQIVEERYTANLPMIVTTNLKFEYLEREQNIEKKRIYSRILEKCYPLLWHGESWRTVQAQNRFDQMIDLLESD